MRGDRRRADVEGDPKGPLGKARPDGDESRPLRSATVTFHSPARNAFCKLASTGGIGLQLRPAPLRCQRLLQPAQIARGIVHVGLGDLDIMQAHDRIDVDRMGLGALAHDLAMHLAVGRHVDDEVAGDPGLATEPSSGRKRAALVGITLLRPRPRGHVDRAEAQRMLRESPSATSIWQRPQMPRPPHTNRDRRRACARPPAR